jgi:DNA-binding beta-propeller fold protein YncE
MRSRFFIYLLLLVPAIPASAHPGVGIVMDRQGNVFYTDLVHVWRIAPNGRKSIVVRNVHTHELGLDSAGNLFGEDSRYEGGDRYRHRIWKRSPNGRITDVVPWHAGFWSEFGLVRDRVGTMYWVRCPERTTCTIRKRTPDGRITTVAPGLRFNTRINWIAAGPDGSLYVVDGRDLRRITREGRVTTIAHNLGPAVMGLWPDAQNNVYVAVYGNRAVMRVSQNGRAVTVARTPDPWGPSGMLVAPNGDLWILEYSTSNQARVRRVAVNGQISVF